MYGETPADLTAFFILCSAVAPHLLLITPLSTPIITFIPTFCSIISTSQDGDLPRRPHAVPSTATDAV